MNDDGIALPPGATTVIKPTAAAGYTAITRQETIIANQITPMLDDVTAKVYTRDLFKND